MVLPKMNKDGIILVDDIHNNSQFMDYIISNKIESWRVFKFQGKFIGMIGDIIRVILLEFNNYSIIS